jgi:hypothetical protein
MSSRAEADITGDRWLRGVGIAGAIAAVLFRLVRLATLPGEMYGDITIVYEVVADAKRGGWPTYFVLSTGPLYDYLIVPIVWLIGLDFQGLKAASALVSLAVLALTYAAARELVDRELAVVSASVAGVSCWLLVFSRLGGSLIVTPLLSIGSVYFAVRCARDHRWWIPASAGVIASAGLYAYPPTFPLAPIMLVTFALLVVTRTGITWRDVTHVAAGALVGALPFAYIFHRDRATLMHGYIGSKFDSTSAGRWSVLAGNVRRALLAFNVRGDTIFRSNPASLPHLDLLSGLLFLAGIVWWLMPARRRWAPVLLVPFLLSLVPSMLVFSQPGEVPSAGRTLVAAPFAYILVGSGLCWIVRLVRRRGVWLGRATLVVLLATIAGVNGHRYFVTYAEGLPDHNTPFGRIIADYLQTLPDDTHAFIVDCCWGEHSQPEPKGIRYLDAGPVATTLGQLVSDELDCSALAELPRPLVLIWSPAVEVPPLLQPCASQLSPQLHTSHGYDVFRSSGA